jgi:putative oxidoreductase
MAIRDEELTQTRIVEKRSLLEERLHAAGRLALSVLFLASAVAKWIRFDDTRRAMDAFGFSGSDILLVAAIGIELTGGLLLAIGYRTRRAAVALIAYLFVLTAILCHDLSVEVNRAVVVATLAIVGGLLLLAAHGAGVLSVEHYFRRVSKDQGADSK